MLKESLATLRQGKEDEITREQNSTVAINKINEEKPDVVFSFDSQVVQAAFAAKIKTVIHFNTRKADDIIYTDHNDFTPENAVYFFKKQLEYPAIANIIHKRHPD